MKRFASLAVVMALLTGPALAFSTDSSMPRMTFAEKAKTKGAPPPATVSTAGKPPR